MNLETILKENADGCSFTRHGNTFTVTVKHTGYFVAITDLTTDNPAQTIQDIDDIAKKLRITEYYYGYWSDGKLHYLDLSLHVAKEEDAKAIGRTFHQKAIWDCKGKEAIYL